MSYQTSIIHGYGICTDHIKIDSIEKLEKLLSFAPETAKEIHEWFEDCEIAEPEVDDYLSFFDYPDTGCGGLAALMQAVIKEAEDISLVACDDSDCVQYLLFSPRYPWALNEKELQLTEETLRQIFAKHVNILTDQVLPVDYEHVENGG